jgi:putative ABC transport system permease protein
LAADIPEIKTYIRTHPMYGGAVVSNKEAKDERTFQEESIQFVDSTFLDVFTYRSMQGDLSTALDDPSSIVITKSMADKYFGKEGDAMGKTLQITGWAPGDYQVTAVIEDVPENSHLSFDFLLPTHKLLEGRQYKEDNGWGWQNFVTYVEFQPNANPKTVEEKAVAFIEKHRGEELRSNGAKEILKFQPLLDIHLNPGLELDSSATMSVSTIYFFIVISIFILAIAWVNYINLSTARAMERAREVGIKKAVGAFRSQLISQFIFESVLVNLIAVILAVLIAVALLPVLGGIVEKNFAFDFTDTRLWVVLTALFVLGSFVSGAYPAFVLSSFNTADVLKGSTEKAGEKFSLRKALVVFQFVSSLILIAGTFAIYRQLMFMQSQDKGLAMEQMLVIKGPSVFEREGIEERLISFKEEVKKIPSVQHVTSSGTVPGGGFNWGTTMRKEGDPVEFEKGGNVARVDTDFIDTYEMEFAAGKKWNPDIASDMESMLVNEAALTAFGLGTAEEALEKRMLLGGDTVAILGVLKDYNWNSLKTGYTPILLAPTKISGRNFSIRLNASSNLQESISKVETLFKEAFPGNPFDYYFLDDFFNRQYKDDQQFASIFSMFAILAIIIACLGLWGLAAFTTTQKLKEISIRKVLGASTASIMSLLSSQFLKLVLIASIISIPLIWYGIDSWLDNFAFKIGLGWDLFIVPTVVLCLIALLTVSLQIFRGANSNPAKVLRSE